MPSGIFYPAAGADDGRDTAAGGGFDNSSNYWELGSNRDSFLRFPSINIAPGATITAAFVRVTIYATQTSTNIGPTCDFSNVDDAAQPADSAAVQALVGTGNTVTWTFPSTADGDVVDSPSLVTALQAILDRPGWSENNAVLFMTVPGTGTARKQISAIEYLAGAEKAELHVTWTEAAGSIAGGLGFGGSFTPMRLSDVSAGGLGFGGSFTGIRLSDYLPGGLGLRGTFDHAGSEFGRTADGGLGLSGGASGFRLAETAAGGLGLNGAWTHQRWRFKTYAGGLGLNGAFETLNYSAWLRANAGKIIRRYVCVLTGDADGETDLTVPIKNAQARMRSGTPTYLGVTIPTLSYASEINLRTNGDLILYMVLYANGVAALTQQIVSVDLEEIRLDPGSRNQSITLSGHRTETYPTKITTLSGVSYRSISGGEYTIRCQPDMFARPGDTAKYDTDEFTVERIMWYLAVGQEQMEIYGQ